jgi:hypothetical protein
MEERVILYYYSGCIKAYRETFGEDESTEKAVKSTSIFCNIEECEVRRLILDFYDFIESSEVTH